MVPHTGQRPAGQACAAPSGGVKRKAPTAKGKGFASADPGRLQTKAGPPQPGKPGKPGKAKKGQGGGAAGVKGAAATEAEKGKGKGKVKAKGKSDIDDIFAGVKRLKEEKAEEEAQRCVARWVGVCGPGLGYTAAGL